MMSKSKKALTIGIIASLVIILIMPLSANAELPGFALGWHDFPGNPVMTLGAASSWNESAVGAASVIYDGGTYKAWVTGFKADGTSQIGYATSPDGKNWTQYASNPVMTTGAAGTWDALGVGSPSVIKTASGTYLMWFTGYSQQGTVLVPAIGYATSPDGIAWTPNATLVITKGAAGTFDEAGALSPSVILDSGVYKMWFTGRAAAAAGETIGTLTIGYATSVNGTAWTVNATPVLSPNVANAWEVRGVGPACVLKSGATYYMWYTGTSGVGASVRTTIDTATSPDGTTWTESGGNPQMSGAAGTWTDMGVGSPAVVARTPGLLLMWYSGINASAAPQLGFAHSVDVDVEVNLQGGGRPASGRVVPITVKVFTAGANVMTAVPLASFTVNTADSGSNSVGAVIPSLGLAAGTYDLTVQSPGTLMNVKRNVAINVPNIVSLGTLLEGDANNSGQVTILDFSILAASYLKSTGQPGFDSRADFDNNGVVNVQDFSLLAANFMKYSPITVP